MKKAVLLITCVALLLSAVGCAASPGDTQPKTDDPSTTQQADSTQTETDSAPTDSAPVGSDSGSEPDSAAPASDEAVYETTYSNVRTYTDSIGTVWVQVIVEIENTDNCDLYLSTSACDLEDASGKLVKTMPMVSAFPDVIAPGEKGYLYESTTLDEAVEGELTLLARPSVEKAKVPNIRLATSEVELVADNYGFLKARGRVENTSDEEQSMVYIVLILKDAENVPIGQMFTILTEDLAVGAKVGFEASGMSLPDDVTADAVASFDVYAYPMQMQF